MADGTPAPVAAPATPAPSDPAAAAPVTPAAPVAPPAAPAAPAADPAPVAPAALPSALSDDPAASATPQDWPTDWREKLAGGDDKVMNLLRRHGDISSVVQKLVNQEKLISSGQFKKALDKDATPEQLAAYRQENGIPETSAGYYEKLNNGLVIGEDDKPYYDILMDHAHATNKTPEDVAGIVDVYQKVQEKQQADLHEHNQRAKVQTQETLRADWGKEYLSNVNAIHNSLEGFFGNAKADVMSATLPDGTLLFNDPRICKAFVAMAREINPVADLVPAAHGSQIQSVEGRLKELDQIMKTDIDAWHKRPDLKQEHLKLLDAQEKLQARGGR